MGIEYYTFALFMFILVCASMCFARLLFNGTKRREEFLNDKEEKLLKLYRDVEELVEDLYERMIENAAEFQRIESLRATRDTIAEMNAAAQAFAASQIIGRGRRRGAETADYTRYARKRYDGQANRGQDGHYDG